jgi:hypothetical protein
MRLQKTTWILIILAVGLTGLVYFYEFHDRANKEEVQSGAKKLFSFQEEDIQSIEINIKGENLKFEITGNGERLWEMKSPETARASSAALSYLTNLLVETKSDRTFTIPPSELEEYGLDKPLATVTITLTNQQVHQMVLGKTDLEDKQIYALIDANRSSKTEVEVSLIPKDFQYAVDRQLNEWKEPI